MKRPQQSNKGFTLVEILVALAIFMMVVAGVLPMYFQSLKQVYTDNSKLDITQEILSMNNRIIKEARQADAYVLYDNFRGAWIDGDFVDFRQSTYQGKGRLRDGESGKFLLLLYYGVDPTPYDHVPAPIDHLVGMYLDANENETVGSLRMFSKDNIDNDRSLEENIPAASTLSSHPIILEEMTGLMDGDIFYNFGGRSVMVNGKIAHQNGAMKETNTYNFTITPR